MNEEEMRLAQPKRMTYVHDIVRDEKRWVETRYVQMYPHMYTPVQYKGIVIESEIVDVKPCR